MNERPSRYGGSQARHWLVALSAVFAVGALNVAVPVLRFTSQAANLAAGCALLTLPVVAPVLVLRLNTRRLARILAVLGLTPLVAVSLLLALLTGSCFMDARATGFDPSFEPLVVLPLGASRVTAYRTNGGAMTAFGIVVRHEKSLVPGLLLVRNVFGQYRAAEATLRAVGPGAVEVRINGAATVLHLRRFVYF